MNLSAPFILRPVMTTFLMLGIITAGLLSFFKLPVSDLPSIEHPTIVIYTGYPGAGSETVLKEVTTPLEKELMQIKGLEAISSTSSQGYSTLVLSFSLDQGMEEAARMVQTALTKADKRLPNTLDPRPQINQQEEGQDPILYLVLTATDGSYGELKSAADTYILPKLKRISGVANVLSFGSNRSLRIGLDPDLMAARNISFDEVIQQVRATTSKAPLGTIETGTKTLALELAEAIKKPQDLENIRIGNTKVRLKEIAQLTEKTEQDSHYHFVTKDSSTPALILAVQKNNGANTVAISDQIKAVIGSLNQELPASIRLQLWFDKSVWIKASLHDVEWSLLIAFLLVVGVIVLSLGRLFEALIISIALPLSLIGTFILMFLFHFSLDLLSLLALTLSVGFVVDDAIVVLENIVRHQEEGANPKEASLNGSKQICFTILSMTLSLVAVFIPLLFMPGMNGKLFREFSITLAAAIFVSGFISLTLTPMLCCRFLSNRPKNAVQVQSLSPLIHLYGRTLKSCFHFPKTILLIAVLLMVGTVPLFTQLQIHLVPPEDRGFLFAYVNLPINLEHAELQTYRNKITSILQANPSVDTLLTISTTDDQFLLIRLKDKGERPPQNEVIAALQKSFDQIPGTQTFFDGYQLINLDFDFGTAGHYRFLVKGTDFHEVEAASLKLTKALNDHPAIAYAKSSVQKDTPKLVIRTNEKAAKELGVEKREVENLLQKAFGETEVGSIQKGNFLESIYIELLPEVKSKVKTLSKLYLTNNEGQQIPLRAIAMWEEGLESPSLKHRDLMPSSTIRLSFKEEISPSEGLKIVEEVAAHTLPANIGGSFDGTAQTMKTTLTSTLILLAAASFVMYVVLGILYESFIHPLTILSSLPLAGLGGILTLLAFSEPLSIFSAVGFLLLIGIVKKNGIMIVDYAIEARANGVSPEAAIYEACLVRFRPIMMTTITAMMGALPIALGLGDSGEMLKGLGLVIVGGLFFSQLLTLYITPVLYLALERQINSFARKF